MFRRRRPAEKILASRMKIKEGVASDQRASATKQQVVLGAESFLRDSLLEESEVTVSAEEFFNLYQTVAAS